MSKVYNWFEERLEIQAIADDEVAIGMQGQDPIANGQVLREEIDRCENDPSARLSLVVPDTPLPEARSKGPRYTPLSKRQEKPDAIVHFTDPRSTTELSFSHASSFLTRTD